MKRLLLAIMLAASPAMAQTAPPQTYTVTSGLLAEIFRSLQMSKLQCESQDATLLKLQAEAQHQPEPPAPKPPEKANP